MPGLLPTVAAGDPTGGLLDNLQVDHHPLALGVPAADKSVRRLEGGGAGRHVSRGRGEGLEQGLAADAPGPEPFALVFPFRAGEAVAVAVYILNEKEIIMKESENCFLHN